MNHLISQRLKNLAYYKSAGFKFETGITCVLGDNKNARTPGATNAAGKSSLFIPLHAALGYAAPMIRGRQGVRDIFVAGSEAGVEFKRGSHVYRAVRRGSKFTVFRDGKDLGIRTQAQALSKLETLRALTETQFYATVYLDSSKPHAFQAGTSAERLHFFTDLFDLHDVDTVRAYCKTLLGDAAAAETELQRLRTELRDIPKVDVTEAKTRYQTLVRRQDKLQRLLRTFVSVKHSLDLWESQLKTEKRVAALTSVVGDATLASVKEQLAAVLAYQEQAAAYSEWKRRKSKLLTDVKDLRSRIPGARTWTLGQAQARLRELDATSRIREPVAPNVDENPVALKRLARLLGTKPMAKHRKTLDKKEGALRTIINEAQSLVNAVAEHDAVTDHSKCPACLSPLSANHFEKMVARAKDEAARARRQLDTLRSMQRALAAELEHREYRKLVAEYVAQTEGYNADDHKLVAKYVRALQAYKAVLADEPDKPKPVTGDAESLHALRDALTELRALRKRQQLSDAAEAAVREFALVNGGLPLDIAVLRTYIGDAEERHLRSLRAANDEIPKLRSELDRADADTARARKLRTSIRELKTKVQDLPVLKLLVSAYDKTGIKTMLVKRLARAVEKNLNRLAPKILREPMSFSLVVENANFHVVATRKNLGKTLVSDVRTLSGAERRMFILLFLLATLPLLPGSKRWDTLVLDEPYANLDPPNIERLRDQLLPRLQKVAPKLVVIVTDRNHVPAGAAVYTAVKHGAESKLVLERKHSA